MGKTILVLGGGIGGLVAANRLRKGLSREHRVVLIEREPDHVFAPSFLWLMTGLRQREKISRPLSKLQKQGIEFMQGSIERVDPDTHTVWVNVQKLAGDYLVIALGAELAPETIPGLAKAGHNFYALTGAEALIDLLTYVPPHRAPQVVIDSGLVGDPVGSPWTGRRLRPVSPAFMPSAMLPVSRWRSASLHGLMVTVNVLSRSVRARQVSAVVTSMQNPPPRSSCVSPVVACIWARWPSRSTGCLNGSKGFYYA